MGGDWAALADLWWRLEESMGFVSTTKCLPTALRLKQVSLWVKNTRIGTPALIVETFSAEWRAWWRKINPEWRRAEDGALKKEGDGPWDALRCPGQNGFLNVLVCLKWWRVGLDAESKDWKDAIADVKWVIEGMVG
ncbi:hypothetical protein FB451DRAFT_1025494 [Mycena latifolia]|nr:hypothetical protein FB451DRAFT_1025494 [Mycena latifolia]